MQSSVHSTSPASRPSPDACTSAFASATHILAAVTSSLDDYALFSVSHLRPIFEAVTRLTFLKHSSDALFTCMVIFNLFPRPSNRNKFPACLLHPLSHSSPHPHSRLQPSSVIIFPPHLWLSCFWCSVHAVPSGWKTNPRVVMSKHDLIFTAHLKCPSFSKTSWTQVEVIFPSSASS